MNKARWRLKAKSGLASSRAQQQVQSIRCTNDVEQG
jgi:hypothetical protein